MATHAMAIAAAPTLSSAPGAEIFSPFSRTSKVFSRVCLTTSGVTTTQRSLALCAGRRSAGPPGNGKRPRSGAQARRKQKSRTVEDGDEDDDAAMEKALEALFTQLDMDLNGEEGGDDDGEEFSNQELEQMTKELEAAFSGMDVKGLEDGEEEEDEEEDSGLVDMVMTNGVYSEASGAAKGGIQKSRKQEYEYFGGEDDEEEEEDDDDDDVEFVDGDEDDEQRMVPLEKWQIRRLAAAAEKGRRKVNVKSLAAELGMDRVDVLAFLKDAPPELMLMAAQWDSEDEAAATAEIPKVKFDFKVDVVDKAPEPPTPRQQPMSPPTRSGGPQVPRNWHGSKRLKKEHIATFERVYRQSSRPSNSMIENLVNLTHVPRKKILQWFDEKRAENQPKKQSFEEAPEN